MSHKIIVLLTAIAVSTTAFAQIKPEDQIKFRQSAMMFMRWNMGKIKNQVVENPQSYNKEQVIAAANGVAAVANSGLGALFGPGTDRGKGWKETRIKEDYFKQPEEVKKLAMAFNKEANALLEVANSGDVNEIKIRFDKLLEACKSCHKKYRAKD